LEFSQFRAEKVGAQTQVLASEQLRRCALCDFSKNLAGILVADGRVS